MAQHWKMRNRLGMWLLAAAMYCAAGYCWAGVHVESGIDHGVDHPLDADPFLQDLVQVKTFDPRLSGLWLQALNRPEADLRLRACQAIGVAAQEGMGDPVETTDRLRQLLMDTKQPEEIPLAAAKALVALDVKEAGVDLLAKNEAGSPEMILLTDMPLAKWKTAGAGAIWRRRLADPATSEPVLHSAIMAMATLGENAGADPLKAMVLDRVRPAPLRIAAARALAVIAPDEGEGAARELVGNANSKMMERFIAALLLGSAKGPGAENLLTLLARDKEPAVVLPAAERLFEIAPQAVTPLNESLVQNADAPVRQFMIRALQQQKSPEAVRLLAALLTDENPSVRTRAREVVISLDEIAGLRESVRSQVTSVLRGDAWQGLEQAALALGALRETEIKDRLLELTRHPRAEVNLAAVIALRRLKLPETLPPLLQLSQELADEYKEGMAAAMKPQPKGQKPFPFDAVDSEMAEVFQFFGVMNYHAADSLLKQFVAKGSGYGSRSRAAAIWTLGHLHEGAVDAALADKLKGRLSDVDMMMPESLDVREMSAVSLGRMQDKSAVETLDLIGGHQPGKLGEACAWAMQQITGKPMPVVTPVQYNVTGWFLEPTD